MPQSNVQGKFRCYSMVLRLPILCLERRYFSYLQRRRYPSSPFLRRLRCILLLWELSLFTRAERLLPRGQVLGWHIRFSTPFCAIDWHYRHPTWDCYWGFETSLYLRWVPRDWWDVPEGGLIFRHDWRHVWSRWEVRSHASPVYERADGAAAEVVSWLARVTEAGAGAGAEARVDDSFYYPGE